jgi:hypothetical protein
MNAERAGGPLRPAPRVSVMKAGQHSALAVANTGKGLVLT